MTKKTAKNKPPANNQFIAIASAMLTPRLLTYRLSPSKLVTINNPRPEARYTANRKRIEKVVESAV